MSDRPDNSHAHPPEPPPERRQFFKLVTHGLGALFTLVLGAPVVAYILDPRHKKARKSDFRTVARLSELKVGAPKQVAIRDVRRDAWTLHPNDVIGRVWLIRRDEKNVDVYTTICPHLGCSINYTGNGKFVCPCHNGTFDMQGECMQLEGKQNPAPRGMDKLESQLIPDPSNEEDKLIQVKYMNFKQGKHTPIPKG